MGLNYLDGFSGYGGFHYAFERAGWKFDNVYFSEIDKHAIANYTYNFPNSIYAGSIDTICESGIITDLDLFTFGWPCQDNSIAGKRKGQSAGTRSGLLYKAVDIIDKFKPRNFVAENVAGLLSVNKGIDIVESLKVLSYLNESMPQYDIEMQLLNTRWFLPQNRERLFFVGHLRGSGSRQIFPIGEELSGFNEGSADTAIVRCFTAGGNSGGMHSGMTLIRALTETRTDEAKQIRKENMRNGRDFSPRRAKELIPRTDNVMNTITANQSKEQLIQIMSATKSGYEIASEGDSINLSVPNSKTRRGRVGKGVAQTLDTACNQAVIGTLRTHKDGNGFRKMSGEVCPTIPARAREDGSGQPVIKDGVNIRRLIPVECERLQGLPDNHTRYGNYNGQIKEISDTQRYRLCGNGISIPPAQAIAEKLKSNLLTPILTIK